jgi:cytochrome c biogenesis protein CcmG, thiol:disulfide interchange protein DsbE
MSSTPGDRRARRRVAREARTGGPARPPALRWLLPGLIVAAVVIAAVLAFVLPGTNSPTTGGSSSLPPSSSTSAGSVATGSGPLAQAPTITGAPLPDFENPNGDRAIGQAAPEVSGTDFTGKPTEIKADGRPKVVMFLAHWCPHCQAEVPLIQTWVSAGGVPQGVDLVSVATGIDPSRPNYPPDAWFQREGWTVPVIADPTNSVAAAYGLAAYPFWVFVGPDGKVVARAAGEITIPDLEAEIGRMTAG